MRILGSFAFAALVMATQAGWHDWQAEPRRIALLIGIADYQHFTLQGSPGQTDLEGPLNDVARLQTSLRRWGFGNLQHTRILTNQQASRAGILQALDWVAAQTTDSADAVVIYFSGHGSFTRDRDGDEGRIAPGDTLDEGLVPWDAKDIHDEGHLVLDDQIRERLAALATRNVTVFLDACYSGTGTRAPGDVPSRRPKGPRGPLTGGGTASGSTSLDLLRRPGHTLITAAGAHQLADEQLFRDEQKVFGAFTYHLTRLLDGAHPEARYDELMQEIRLAMSGAFLPQTPQLEGDQAARLFNVRGAVARRPYAVVERSAAGLVIDMGAVHGVRESSIFDVFPPAEMNFRSQPLTQLRVDSVAATTSYVSAIGGASNFANQARAVLARVPRGAQRLERLPVYVGSGGSRASLEKLDFIEIVSDPATTTVRLEDTHVKVRGAPLPSLADDSSLCSKLQRAWAITAFELIQNPQPSGDVSVQLRFVPAGKQPDDRPVSVDTIYVGADYDVYAKVTAPADARLFLTAAVAGYSSPAMVLYPSNDVVSSLVQVNTWNRIFSTGIEKPAGIEVIKVVVGTDPFDFNPLIGTMPQCNQARSARVAWNPGAASGMWRTAEHRLLILGSKP
jgi:hypothetical protein